MTLRHTTTLSFHLESLVDIGLTRSLRLTPPDDTGANGPAKSYDYQASARSQSFKSAHRRMTREFSNAVANAAGYVRIELDMDSCDALIASLVELRIDGDCRQPALGKFDRAICYIQSARETLVKTADAWRGTDHMELETIHFTNYESSEVVHWMEVNEADNEHGRRDCMSEAEKYADIRLLDHFANSLNRHSLTGDLGMFRALKTTMEVAQELALDRDYQGLECAELRYRDLMGKIDDAISSLEWLESDVHWRLNT